MSAILLVTVLSLPEMCRQSRMPVVHSCEYVDDVVAVVP